MNVDDEHTCGTWLRAPWMRPVSVILGWYEFSDRVCDLIFGSGMCPVSGILRWSHIYDIMHNGGNLTLPTWLGERRLGIGCVSRPTTILFPYLRHLVTLTHGHVVIWTLRYFGTWNLGYLTLGHMDTWILDTMILEYLNYWHLVFSFTW